MAWRRACGEGNPASAVAEHLKGSGGLKWVCFPSDQGAASEGTWAARYVLWGIRAGEGWEVVLQEFGVLSGSGDTERDWGRD